MRTWEQILKSAGYDYSQMEQFLARCCSDFVYFAEHVLGFAIADYHKEWQEAVESWDRVCIEAFRGSGKTCFFAGYYVWKGIFTQKPKNFLIVSNNFEQSKLVLKTIRSMVADNDLLKEFMPKGREESWKATELTLQSGSIYYCRPYGEGIRGLRIDYLLCDEIGMYEDKSIYWQVVVPVVQLNMGRIISIGTPKSHVDLLAELFKNDEYYSKKYPAEQNGQPLWPDKYTMQPADTPTKRSLLKVKREMGELNYQQEYMLVPVSSANSVFPMELIQSSLDDEMGFLPYGKINEQYYIGADLALSEKGDYTVFTVISANEDGKKVVYVERFRGTPSEQRTKMDRLIQMFNPIKICVDKTGMGESIFVEWAKLYNHLEPIHFSYDEKFKLIMDLRYELETFNLAIPNSKEDLRAYSYTEELVKEMSDFVLKVDLENRTKTRTKFSSGKYDDCVISLSLAVRASQNIYGDVSISAI
jgi:hypothetical protein